MPFRSVATAGFIGMLAASLAFGQDRRDQTVTIEMLMDEIKALRKQVDNQRHNFDQLEKAVDDIMWRASLDDIAVVDKFRMTGPPLRHQPNPTAQGAGNRLVFRSYTFIPKKRPAGKKIPLIVLPHGGVHGDFNT